MAMQAIRPAQPSRPNYPTLAPHHSQDVTQHQQAQTQALAATVPGTTKQPAATLKPAPALKIPAHVVQPHIMQEEFDHYLYGGYQNRLTLALKSGLPNEIDWACHKLMRVSHGCPDNYNVLINCPQLIEAIVQTLSMLRQDLAALSRSPAEFGAAVAADDANVADDLSGESIVAYNERVRRSGRRGYILDRACMLALALRNFSHLGETAKGVAADPCVTEEALQWLSGDFFVSDELNMYWLDIIEALIPLYQPFVLARIDPSLLPSDARFKWPYSVGPQLASSADLEALYEEVAKAPDSNAVRLWKELTKFFLHSTDKATLVGAMCSLTLLAYSNPQLSKHLLLVPLDDTEPSDTYASRTTGAAIAHKCSQYLMVPDLELTEYGVDLLGEIIRMDSDIRTLEGTMRRKQKPLKRSRGSILLIRAERSQSVEAGSDMDQSIRSDTSSGQQTAYPTAIPRILPDGLANLLVGLALQWEELLPEEVKDAVKSKYTPSTTSALGSTNAKPAGLHGTTGTGPSNAQQNLRQQTVGRPTEAELREACTWVLLSYEKTKVPTDTVSMADLFQRYTIAKRVQTVPQVGRTLLPHEMYQVVKAVFPEASCVSFPVASQPGMTTIIIRGIRPRSAKIHPIVAISPNPNQQQQQQHQASTGSSATSTPRPSTPRQIAKPNYCQWEGCDCQFTSEADARAHISNAHLPAKRPEEGWSCKWSGCRRFAATGNAPQPSRKTVLLHCLTHGPFYKPTAQDCAHSLSQQRKDAVGHGDESAAMEVEERDKSPTGPSAVGSDSAQQINSAKSTLSESTPLVAAANSAVSSPRIVSNATTPSIAAEGSPSPPPSSTAATEVDRNGANDTQTAGVVEPPEGNKREEGSTNTPNLSNGRPSDGNNNIVRHASFLETLPKDAPWKWPLRLQQPTQLHELMNKTMSALLHLAHWERALSVQLGPESRLIYEENQIERLRVAYDSPAFLFRLATLADKRPILAEFAFRIAAVVQSR